MERRYLQTEAGWETSGCKDQRAKGLPGERKTYLRTKGKDWFTDIGGRKD